MNLDQAYDHLLEHWTDVQANIPTLEQAVKDTDAKRVIELGVRWCASTVVLLHALQDTGGELWSVDCAWPSGPFVGVVSEQINWHFVRGDDLDRTILDTLPDDVDLVFVDTSHGRDQTWNELAAYKRKVRQYGQILLHDSELEYPETAPEDDPPFPVKEAMREFTDDHKLRYELDRNGYGCAVVYC